MSSRLALGALALPLLLVSAIPADSQKRAAVEPADNSYCLVCHSNLKREHLADTHRKAGVGCATCHGESDKHSSDEDNITPPDIMYPREKVNSACSACHAPAALARADRKAVKVRHSAKQVGKKTCLDCHSTHRLPVRTRRWDRNTRQLIKDDGVRMVNPKK